MGIQSWFNEGTINKDRKFRDNQQGFDHWRLDNSKKLLPIGLQGLRKGAVIRTGKERALLGRSCGLQSRV